MIKIFTKGRNGPVVGFGLSFANLSHLQQGEPIKVDGAEVGMKGTTFLIFAGETEESMRADLVEQGVLPAEVKAKGRIRPGHRQEWRRQP